MNRIAAFVADHLRLIWLAGLTVILCASLLSMGLARSAKEDDRLIRLTTETERRGIEIMSQTLNGNIMGSLSLLGKIDEDVKWDALDGDSVNRARMAQLLENVARTYDADGVFVVGRDGLVKSSWDSSGRPSTGLDVNFRPYFRQAMQGRDNVYAAISLARGDRSLYFSTPVFAASVHGQQPAGAVVARLALTTVDALLHGRADITLLLSPQGVVFAGNRPEWIGWLAGAPSPERLQAIRNLKQFGAMFDNRDPMVLPFPLSDSLLSFEGRRYALASAKVQWNDPSGDWSLVQMEDLSKSAPILAQWPSGLVTAVVMLALWGLAVGLLRGHHLRSSAARRIETFAREQEASLRRKSELAAAALAFQRAKSAAGLAQRFLDEAHRLLGALQGLVYVREDGEAMRLAATFAAAADVPMTLALGEGLLGQCALDRQPRLLETPEDGAWTIRSGLGGRRPAAVLMEPLVLDEMALGVVEIALLETPHSALREQFAELTALLALNLEILRHQTRPVTEAAGAAS